MEAPTSVPWWIPAGALPTVEDAKFRLESLRANGATLEAFTFTVNFDPLGVDAITAAVAKNPRRKKSMPR